MSHLRRCLFFSSLCGIFILFFVIYSHQLAVKEQFSLFLNGGDFFCDFLNYPGGITGYVGLFCTQIFQFRWIGSLLITVIAIIEWGLARKILSAFCPKKDLTLFALVPIIFGVGLYTVFLYHFSLIVAILFSFVFFCIYLSIKQTYLRYFSALIFLPLAYWIGNISCYSFLLLFILYECLIKKEKGFWLVSLLGLVVGIALPYIAYSIGMVPLRYSVFYSDWVLSGKIHSADIVRICSVFAILPVLCLSLWLCEKIRLNKKLKFVPISLEILLVFLPFYLIYKQYDASEATAIKIIDQVSHFQWNDIINEVEKKKNPEDSEWMAYNFALAKEGKTASHLLKNKNNSADYYQLESENDFLAIFLQTEFYYHLGLLNPAFYEYMNTNDYLKGSRLCLQRMADISDLKGDTLLAKKYQTLLKKNLFYVSRNDLPKQTLSVENKVSTENHFKSRKFMSDIYMYVQSETGNRVADEYLLAYLLLSGSAPQIRPVLEKVIREYYPEKIPDAYQQALLYSGYSDENQTFTIDEKNKTLFESYKQGAAPQGSYFNYLLWKQ